MLRHSTALLAALILGGKPAVAFYLPGPQSFSEGDPVELKVNKMTSQTTLLPVDYYRLPFCRPPEGPKMDNENLGEFLAGDRIESSPYRLQMKKEMYCEQLCVTNLGMGEKIHPSKVVRAIRKNYHNNWIVDNLPSASKVEDDAPVTTRYWGGFPIGFIGPDFKAYINNHVNIQIMYHPVETEVDKYRVVRFTVEPFSIRHVFDEVDNDDDQFYNDENTDRPFQVAHIKNAIYSCNPKNDVKPEHTDYNMIASLGREPQPASGKVLFTYDVLWVEDKDLHWASRWDIYLTMDRAIPARVHWLGIMSGLVIMFVLAALTVAVFTHSLRRDSARYNQPFGYSHLLTDEENAEHLLAGEANEQLEETGWKAVHADVFRPPSFSPLLLACCCGTGAQLLFTAFFTIILSAMGLLSPANRGARLMAELLLYSLMGSVAGYVTARLYKTFKGEEGWQRAAKVTALGFPGICFAVFFILDLIAMAFGSTYAVPFTTMLILLVLWLVISAPLVFFGAYLGYNAEAIEFPVNPSSTPRQIPEQPWFRGIPFTLAVGGIAPFLVYYNELCFILDSVWMDQYYCVFGFLILIFLIWVVTCAEITVLFCYFQLHGENYHWWWRSFCTAGTSAFYVFLYSVVYFRQLEAKSFAAHMLYFGYMGLACLGLFLMTGFIGVSSSLWFNKKIFVNMEMD